MFKHVLIPTDGSPLAAKGAKAGVKLAKALGARVTGVYVISPYVPMLFAEGARFRPGDSPQDYKRASEKAAKKALAAVEIEAQTGGVLCDTRFVTGERPWQGILEVARSCRCDVISMTSHGRGAMGGLLLGSETQRVLASSKIPVLVTR
jgi:nucleotide-binding universal stress UspA family protein